MRNSIFKVSVLLAISILQEGCLQKKPHISQAGEVVIWKETAGLIIKARLGERREHIPDTHCTRCENEFYRPWYEHYIGQFPIDYVPERFERLTPKEANKLPVQSGAHGLEFNLMLNGSKVKATDASPHGKGLDNQDQVKVFVKNVGITHPKIDTQHFFESELMKELDSNSKIMQHGLECYKFKDGHEGGRCFGKSKNKLISGFYFYISPDRDYRILVRSNEFTYGGVKIEWFMDQKNIDQAQKVDEAIWRLLDAWNISPLN